MYDLMMIRKKINHVRFELRSRSPSIDARARAHARDDDRRISRHKVQDQEFEPGLGRAVRAQLYM